MRRIAPTLLLLATVAHADTARLPLPAGLPERLDPIMEEAGCFDSGRCTFEQPDGVPVAILASPPLTDAERTAIEAILARHRAGKLTAADYTAIQSDVSALQTYAGLASPTAAQTAAATKAIIRVLRVLVRQ